MCIVPDHEIESLLANGRLKIIPYSKESLTPNGYDLRVAEVRIEGGDTVKEGVAILPAKEMFHLATVERVELPDDIAAQMWTRTSWIRKGLLIGLGKVDAGFHGSLTFMGFNASAQAIEMPINSRVVQIVFETMHSPVEKTYEKRSGNYQGQSGITLGPAGKRQV
jgi:dCTP deaminase